MFDLFFNAISAWNQIGMLFLGVVFSLIGGAMIAYDLYWKFTARRIKGKIIEVYVVGKGASSEKNASANSIYYPVYEYQSPYGDVLHHQDGTGSSGLLTKKIGTRVSLLMKTNPPFEIQRNNIILLSFGCIFMAPGLFVLYQAVTAFEFNIFTFVFFFIILGVIGFKASHKWSKIPQKDRTEIKAFIKNVPAYIREKKLKDQFVPEAHKNRKGVLLSAEEIRIIVKREEKSARMGGGICLVLSMVALTGAYYTGQGMRDRLSFGMKAMGAVVAINGRESNSSDGNSTMYYSKVSFVDQNGNKRHFEDGVGSSYPLHKRGQKVSVLYNPEDPEDSIIDRGIWNWTLSGGCFLAFLLFLYGSIVGLRAGQRAGRV